MQVHRAFEGLYVMRQSKQVNFEGNFLYLVVGCHTAILFDTGAVGDADCSLLEHVMDLISTETSHLRLIVAHTHSHDDHVGGDSLFRGIQNVTIVEHGVTAVSDFFGFTPYTGSVLDESHCSTIDLGDRVLDIFHIPGHHPDHIAVFDRKSGALLTGDFVYPGRLYVHDRVSFLHSLTFLYHFCQSRVEEITGVLGSHIEMTNTLGYDYPDGTLFQPDEAQLPLTVLDIVRLYEAVAEANRQFPLSWGILNIGFCIVVPISECTSEGAPYKAKASRTCIALISEVYISENDDLPSPGVDRTRVTPQDRLQSRLLEAKSLGATIAVLPELPMDVWYPQRRRRTGTANSILSTNTICASGMTDARVVAMSSAARAAEITLVGGVIMYPSDLPGVLSYGINMADDTAPAERLRLIHTPHNITLLFSPNGEIVATHMKQVLPEEEGFWESDYFAAARYLPSIKRGIIPGFPICIQTCSDIMRPASAQIMSALGSAVIVNPRATEASSSERWRNICVGIAATTSSYIVSVPRPKLENELLLGGDSFCISPCGAIESLHHPDSSQYPSSPITLCYIDALEIGEARVKGYPGYLKTHPGDFSLGWNLVADHIASFR